MIMKFDLLIKKYKKQTGQAEGLEGVDILYKMWEVGPLLIFWI